MSAWVAVRKLATRAITQQLTLSADKAIAWWSLAPQRWAFRSDAERHALVASAAQRLSQLQGRRLHLRVTTMPLSVDQWQRELAVSTRAYLPGWPEHVISEARHLARLQLTDKRTFLGVELARPASRWLGWLGRGLELGHLEGELRDIDRIVAGPGLEGRPATTPELAWLVRRSIALGCPPCASDWWEEPWHHEDLAQLTEGAWWTLDPYGRTIRVEADVGSSGVRVVRHIAVVCVGRMADELPLDPWAARTDRLAFPVELSATIDVLAPRSVVKNAQSALLRVRSQREHYLEHRLPPPFSLDRAYQRAQEVQDEVERGLEGLSTRTDSWWRIAVSGESEDEALDRARQVADLYAPQITAVRTAGQHGLAREMIPGEPLSSTAYRRRLPVTTLAASMPAVTAQVGDRVGHLIGWTSGATGPRAVCWDLHRAMEQSERSGLTLVAGHLGSGKALALDTPVPTPTGWTTMGEIRAGDAVIGGDGRPVRVVAATSPLVGRPCYRVTFSDGTTVVADANHQWLTYTSAARYAEGGRPAIVTTAEMARSLLTDGSCPQANHAVATVTAQFDEVDLPIPPYVLGLWLRDGHARNKHVPPAYLRASEEQRRELLAGLLDTDGYCTPGGTVELALTDEQLSRDAHELVVSLGYEATLRQKRCTNGRPGKRVEFTVAFTPTEDVFHPGRETARQGPSTGRGQGTRRMHTATRRLRYIIAVEPVESVPVRCIQVEAPDGLFLVSRSFVPTHNSHLAASVVYRSVLAGVPWTVLDPAGAIAKLCELPELEPYSRHVDLLHAPQPGILSPYALIADARRDDYRTDAQWQHAQSMVEATRRTLACDILNQLLPAGLAEDAASLLALRQAARVLPGHLGVNPRALLEQLRQLEDEDLRRHAKLVADFLDDLSQLPACQLIFGSGTDIDCRHNSHHAALTVVSLSGLTLPPDATPRREYTADEGIAVPLLQLAAHLATRPLYEMPPGARKGLLLDEALALDTPIPTPAGWVSMGDLEAGDEVFGSDGLPTTVAEALPIQVGRECYRVTFADGTSMVASGGHRWLTCRTGQDPGQVDRVRTTEEMFRWANRGPNGSTGTPFRVPVHQAVELPDQPLPVDPYVLGLWLGDGHLKQSYICAPEEDAAFYEKELCNRGVPALVQEITGRPQVRRVALGWPLKGRPTGGGECFTNQIQALGVYGDKHIPAVYRRGSRSQRLDLVRGLMDTNGSVSSSYAGFCTFVNSNERIVDGLVELLRSLGVVPRVIWRPDARSRTGGYWKVRFTAHDLAPFLLPRKVDKLRVAPHRRIDRVTIASIEPVESVPVRCINVAAPDHLFLAGDGWHVTHNSHVLTRTTSGRQLLQLTARQSRRLNLRALYVSQTVGDFEAAGLLPHLDCAWIGQLEDEEAQRAGCRALRVPEEYASVLGTLSRHRRDTPGRRWHREFVWADGVGGVERVVVDASGLPERVQRALDTTPHGETAPDRDAVS